MKQLMWCIGLFICHAGWSSSFIEKHCQTLSVQNEEVVINSKQASLIFLHNISDKTVWITHPTNSAGASAGWTSELTAKRWSVLFSAKDTNNFNLACVQSEPGHEQYIPCADSIQVCILSPRKLPRDANGVFWAVENVRKKELLSGLEQRGFALLKGQQDE